jgi:hypothetical protein
MASPLACLCAILREVPGRFALPRGPCPKDRIVTLDALGRLEYQPNATPKASGTLDPRAVAVQTHIRSAEALIPVTPRSLVTSPASVQFVFPGAPDPTVVLVTNNTGGATTILSIVLSAGPLGTTTSTTPCLVGTILAANATCTIGLSS